MAEHQLELPLGEPSPSHLPPGISSLPVGIRGVMFSFNAYKQDLPFCINKLQEFLNIPLTGQVDTGTLAAIENVVQLEGTQMTINKLSQFIVGDQANGVTYRVGQFACADIPVHGRTPAKNKAVLLSFDKDSYMQPIKVEG